MSSTNLAIIPESEESLKLPFLSLTREELAQTLAHELGFSSYRADQLFSWVYKHHVFSPEEMTNIGKADREKLKGLFQFPDFGYDTRQISVDGTRKYLFELSDKKRVESVMIKQPTRMTLCVSSQVGCALGCKFCQTGTMGLIRHLSTEEILKQVLSVKIDAKNFDDDFTNMVFMGMGEPLHNFNNVSRAINILTDHHGIALPRRKITVSTVGLVPAIRRFFDENVQSTLAVSLNATTDEIRDRIMPINKKYPLDVLLGTLRQAPLGKRDKVTIEYVMLAGVNDSKEDLERLPKLLNNIPCKINLIPYNDNAGLGFDAPEEANVYRWQKQLQKRGLTATIRWSKGKDIDAACGQLVTNSTKTKKSALAETVQL